MSDDAEIRQLRQEREIYRLRAQLAEANKRNSDLQRMHDADQRYIGKLQAQIKRAAANAIFSEGQ